MNELKVDSPKPAHVTWRKEIITTGIWGSRPRDGAKCEVTIEDMYSEDISLNEISQTDVSMYLTSEFNGNLIIGEGDTEIDRALNRVIRTMLKREVCLMVFTFTLHSDRSANGLLQSNTSASEQLGGYSARCSVKCTVLLKEIYNEPYIFEWSDSKKYDVAMQHKTRGVELFNSGRTKDAFMRFSKALKLIITTTTTDTEYEFTDPQEELLALRVILCNNIASCHLRYKNYIDVITMCNKVLDIEQNNVKALFRRAVAEIELQKYEEANADLLKILLLEPGNIAAKEKLTELKQKQKVYDTKMANAMKKMFIS